ncbi:MAG: hypothetical protein JWP08_4084 [Bryobacterales bacterium]|nr:hypothetical protein [Bryobacterales bacterium]
MGGNGGLSRFPLINAGPSLSDVNPLVIRLVSISDHLRVPRIPRDLPRPFSAGMPTGGTSLDADFDSVIDGLDEVLLGAEVAFGGLDGGVPQE